MDFMYYVTNDVYQNGLWKNKSMFKTNSHLISFGMIRDTATFISVVSKDKTVGPNDKLRYGAPRQNVILLIMILPP